MFNKTNTNALVYHYSDGTSFASRYDMIMSMMRNSHKPADYFTVAGFADVDYFERNPDLNIDEESKKFLSEIRETSNKFAFYYSGGVDSHFILNQFIKHKIFPDKIVCISDDRMFPDNFVYRPSEEIKYAWKRLNDYKDKGIIPSRVVLEKRETTAEMVNTMLKSERYLEFQSLFYCNLAILRSSDHCLLNGTDIDYDVLVGQSSSNVYFNLERDCWEMSFVDGTLDQNPLFANLISFNMQSKRVMEAHLNSIINELEKVPNYKQQFSFNEVVKMPSKHVFRNMIPEYRETIRELEFSFIYPKLTMMGEPPEDLIELINSCTSKMFVTLLLSQLTNPDWYQEYCKTVNKYRDFITLNKTTGGILMKPIPIR